MTLQCRTCHQVHGANGRPRKGSFIEAAGPMLGRLPASEPPRDHVHDVEPRRLLSSCFRNPESLHSRDVLDHLKHLGPKGPDEHKQPADDDFRNPQLVFCLGTRL